MSIRRTIARLERRIERYERPDAIVAFSGGVDSAVVVALAAEVLGRDHVTAVTAVSPSYPSGELEVAAGTAASIGVEHRVIETHEVEREAYVRNDDLRCFHCKVELYSTLGKLAADAAPHTVVMAGANADDLGDFRPGLKAAEQQGVRNPLLEEGVGKETVRAIATRFGLSVADKPALACLSSRVAYGERITPELLARIDRAEQAVRSLGFDVVRVRHHGDAASIEVLPEDVDRLSNHPRLGDLAASLRDMGWTDVGIDLEGYRQGSMNDTLVGGS